MEAAFPKSLPVLAAELTKLKVDAILTTGTPAALAAKQATKTIPIVFTLATDPVESGLVASLSRPGGNLTGFAQGIYHEKLLETLKRTLPQFVRVASAYPAVWQNANEPEPPFFAAARALGLQIKGFPMKRPDDLARFYTAAQNARIARPGGNVTGLNSLSIELWGKQVGLLKELVPTLSRVAVLSGLANPANIRALREVATAARGLGLRLQTVEVREAKDLDDAFSAMIRERADALIVLTDPVLLTHRTQIVDLAARNRLPAIYGGAEYVEAGGLMAYAASRVESFQRAASYVDKILKGAKPADLPVEQATKFDLIINLKTAKALGLKIPQPLLLRADEVIQ